MGTLISALIVDDEPLARQRLRGLLQAEQAVEVVGECENGDQAIVAIHTVRPQIVFLDVQMPGCDGLQLAARLPEQQRPLLIFVTAHERYALEAFNLKAVDYLLKPFGSERLHEALSRARAQLHAPRVGPAAPPTTPGNRVSFRIDGRIVFFQVREITRAESGGDCAWLYLSDRRVVVHETLAAIESQLGPHGFIPINHSILVRFDQIREVRLAECGEHTLLLHDGTKLPLSRSLRGQLGRFSSETL